VIHRKGMTMHDLKRPMRQKQEQYLQLFSQMIEEYYAKKHDELKQIQETRKTNERTEQ